MGLYSGKQSWCDFIVAGYTWSDHNIFMDVGGTETEKENQYVIEAKVAVRGELDAVSLVLGSVSNTLLMERQVELTGILEAIRGGEYSSATKHFADKYFAISFEVSRFEGEKRESIVAEMLMEEAEHYKKIAEELGRLTPKEDHRSDGDIVDMVRPGAIAVSRKG